jgi:Peptidase family M23
VEYQIVLLPRDDYWVWLRACRKYVLTFGAGLTDDPGTAARYMAPRQVITLPSRGDAFPEIGNASRWLQSRYPGVRVDVVNADTPDDMRDELSTRVAENDRYGARRRKFYLLWPTDYAVVTQNFGANPQIYRRYALPGHEGIDFRALTNTNVYACADGEVYEVHTGAKDHAYGIHIRIQHRDSFKTVYAHLARALVGKGDRVKAGQIIGRADSTGNSSASHLHLSLKRDGATARKETTYPKDIIDPTPYLVWPAQGSPQGKVVGKDSGATWEAGRCLVGVRRIEARPLDPGETHAVHAGRAEALLLGPEAGDETILALQSVRPGILLVARLPIDLAKAESGPESAARELEPVARRMLSLGVRDFEVHSEPNLSQQGLGRLWGSGQEFGRWFVEIAGRLRSELPEARFGFPMLSPGEEVQGKRRALTGFLSEAEESIAQADWIGVGCYWSSTTGMELPSEGRVFEVYRSLFPDKLLMLTGLGPASPALPESEAARQVAQFLDRVRDVPGIAAAFAGTTSPTEGWENLAWTSPTGEASELAQALGRRKG